ncbi:DUF1566 domain-containing protein [Halioglobus maricola]|uniref:Lcl domain-containing protein n=1 Tax=Halioglobus maricola TaxID=2601894 RepID=UPI00147811F3|nr:DUF1566 domain-containing protein [Halioglobus maricola]
MSVSLCVACSDTSDRATPVAPEPVPQESEVWLDEVTGLHWQLYGKGSDNPEFLGIIPAEAYEYCQQLEAGGYSDWRLPRFAELQSILVGNPAVEAGGECRVGAPGAGTSDGITPACASTAAEGEYGGPGLQGCYWKEGLKGACDRIDPFGRHPYETLAADPANDKPDNWISYITFATGAAGYNHACSLAEVRCVRSDEPSAPCELNGQPCHDFYRSVAHCEQDLTSQADTLRVTVTLPGPLPVEQPYQLLGFLYESGPNWYPPIGPPAGGTDYNQVFFADEGAPIFDETTPFVMEIPATTYYREALLEGQFQLFFMLQSVNVFPPIPVDGDFVYGEGEAAIAFPLNGAEHSAGMLELEVELSLVGCPDDTPTACRDGSCAVDEAACELTSLCPESSSCHPDCPGDDDILSCVYENGFDAGALTVIDYPLAEGWNESDALETCATIAGVNNPRIVHGGGQSALVQQGGSASGRCVVEQDSKHYFLMDVGDIVCNFAGGVWESTGPYCESYATP